MPPRNEAKLQQPIVFAHRGASAIAADNTIESFQLGLKLGANGLESDVWITGDAHAVLDHDGRLGRFPRRKAIADALLADLPAHIPSLRSFFDEVGCDFDLSLDLKDPGAIDAAVDTLRAVEQEQQAPVVSRTWLCHPDLSILQSWRSRWSDVRLVHSTRLHALPDGPERHGAALFESGVDTVNMHHTDWTGGLTALYHRFGVYCFGWDAQIERVAYELFDMGLDAVYGNHVERLCAGRDRVYG